MTIEIRPETEQLVRKEIENGHFRSVDEIIAAGVQSWHSQKSRPQLDGDRREQAIAQALDFALNHSVALQGVSIKELIHEGHRL